jgi:hypothetical protein
MLACSHNFATIVDTTGFVKTPTWRMPSYGMWRRVDLVWTDVSEKRIASNFGVEKSLSEEPAWAGGCRLTSRWRRYVPPKRRFTQDLQGDIPEDDILHSHRRENLKSYKTPDCFRIPITCVRWKNRRASQGVQVVRSVAKVYSIYHMTLYKEGKGKVKISL